MWSAPAVTWNVLLTPCHKMAEESSGRLGIGAHAVCGQAEGSGLNHSEEMKALTDLKRVPWYLSGGY